MTAQKASLDDLLATLDKASAQFARSTGEALAAVQQVAGWLGTLRGLKALADAMEAEAVDCAAGSEAVAETLRNCAGRIRAAITEGAGG